MDKAVRRSGQWPQFRQPREEKRSRLGEKRLAVATYTRSGPSQSTTEGQHSQVPSFLKEYGQLMNAEYSLVVLPLIQVPLQPIIPYLHPCQQPYLNAEGH